MKLLYEFKHLTPSSGKVEELAIRRPTRLEMDDVEMFYAQYYADCVRKGCLTKEMLQKLYKDAGGPLSKEEMEEYASLLSRFIDAGEKIAEAKTEKTKEKHAKEKLKAFSALQEIEARNEDLFSQAADTKARNRVLMYLFLMLAYHKNDDGEYVPLFSGDDFEEQYSKFSKYEEDNDIDAVALLEHFTFLIYYWYSNSHKLTYDDFRAYEALSNYMVYDDLDGKEPASDSTE